MKSRAPATELTRSGGAGAGVSAGLVSVSTTHTPPNPTVPTVFWMGENCITIDRQKSRVVRMRKGLGTAAKCIHNRLGPTAIKVMVTLTYAGTNADWRPEQVRDYLTHVRNWYARETGGLKLSYVWVAELQQRGVIHYHAVFWMRKGVTMPRADDRGWWPHGMTRTEKAEKPIGYLMSYLSKIESKNIMEFPHGARIYGVGGLDKDGRDCKRWILWPSYIQGNAQVGEPWRPAKGGGFANSSTGQHLESEWAPIGRSCLTFFRLRTHTRRIKAAGPFSWHDASLKISQGATS